MKYLHLLFLFVLLLSSCHSRKEVVTQAAYTQEVARSDIAVSDVDARLNTLVNRDVVITLEDIVVQYQPGDSSNVSDIQLPKIRNPGTTATVSIGQITISDTSEESMNLSVEDNSSQTSELISNGAAEIRQNEKKESAKLKPSNGAVFFFILAVFFCVFVVMYYKSKVKL